MKKKKEPNLLVIVIGFMVVIIALNLFFILGNLETLDKIEPEHKEEIIKQLNLTSDPLSTEGYTKYARNEISINSQTITLIKECKQLDIFTNEYQLYTIDNGLKGLIDMRPTTHDVFEAVMENFNIKLIDVRISKTEDIHYFARAIFKQNNKILNIDIKASDAIALAVRTNSPIYVSNKILENNAKSIC